MSAPHRPSAPPSRRQKVTAFALTGIVAGMLGLSYAAVPLYRLFCQVTGFGGTTQVASQAPTEVLDRLVTVRFNADVGHGLPWSFEPVERDMTLRIGENGLAFYRVHNTSDRPIVGTATFNVTPAKAGQYFNKIACFCFTEQRLEPGETMDMPVSFFVDPSMARDRAMNDLSNITLSYTFFPVEQPAAPNRTAAAPGSDGKTIN